MRKKILLVTRPISPPWDEASKNFAYNLAMNLPDFDFYLLTNGIIPDLPKNVHQKPIYTSNNFSYFQKLRLIKHLRKMRNDFDILHYIFTPTKQNTFLIKKFSSGKKAKAIQTAATLREDLYSDGEIKKLMFADKIVTYSKYAKYKLNNLGFNNVDQIYPGINLNQYSPSCKDAELMKALNLCNKDFVVTFPGEFTRLGATDDIVEAIIKIASSSPPGRGIKGEGSLQLSNIPSPQPSPKGRGGNIFNIKFVFACRIKNKDDLIKKEEVQKKLKKKGLLDLVRFPETFTTLDKMLNASDLVIFPIRDMKGKFDVPLAVIEAMACAKPVIISDLPILKEFANNENSVIIESGNVKQLSDAILDLCQDKEKRETIGKNARKFAQDYFDIKNITKQYSEIYKNL